MAVDVAQVLEVLKVKLDTGRVECPRVRSWADSSICPVDAGSRN